VESGIRRLPRHLGELSLGAVRAVLRLPRALAAVLAQRGSLAAE
jgi:hypothetical protein